MVWLSGVSTARLRQQRLLQRCANFRDWDLLESLAIQRHYLLLVRVERRASTASLSM